MQRRGRPGEAAAPEADRRGTTDPSPGSAASVPAGGRHGMRRGHRPHRRLIGGPSPRAHPRREGLARHSRSRVPGPRGALHAGKCGGARCPGPLARRPDRRLSHAYARHRPRVRDCAAGHALHVVDPDRPSALGRCHRGCRPRHRSPAEPRQRLRRTRAPDGAAFCRRQPHPYPIGSAGRRVLRHRDVHEPHLRLGPHGRGDVEGPQFFPPGCRCRAVGPLDPVPSRVDPDRTAGRGRRGARVRRATADRARARRSPRACDGSSRPPPRPRPGSGNRTGATPRAARTRMRRRRR